MSRPVVVFLGPTLSSAVAARYLRAIYLPPAEQGSVVAAVRTHDPMAIVLIDGQFGKVPAVRHKEILWAMGLGIPFFGVASMGALRAAELDPFGMRGFGLVFRWYRRTLLADDDEVAVAMAPAELGSIALSDALINIRLTLRAAERRNLILREVRVALEDTARSMHFMERTYESIFAQARTCFPKILMRQVDIAEDFARRQPVDQKRTDAISLLTFLSSARVSDLRTPTAGFRMTEAWARDLAADGYSCEEIDGISVLRSLRAR